MSSLNRQVDNGVLTIELARAPCGNALNRATQVELIAAWNAFEDDESLRVAVLCGSADVFSIGHDVAELAADPSMSPVPDIDLYPLHLSKPVIAAIDGPCYGLGFELALACDLRVAGEAATFGFVDTNLHVPFRVASVLLPRMTLLGTALDLIYSGAHIGAAQMRELGLVSEVAATGHSVSCAVELAHAIARRFGPGRDVRKQGIWALSGVPLPAAMQSARRLG